MKNAQKNKKIFLFSLFIIFYFTNFLYSQNFYWENPREISNQNSMFPKTLSNSSQSFVFWQEVDFSKKEIYLCFQKNQEGDSSPKKIAGPFSYSSIDVPEIYSVAILNNGTFAVSIVENSSIFVFSSTDGGETFSQTKLKTLGLMISPKIFKTNANAFKMFVSFGNSDSFNIYTCDSKDGINWSKFEIFEPSKKLKNSFLPVLIPYKNGDVVVFQSQFTPPNTTRFSYQLYATFRGSEKGKWSEPILLTNENSFYKNNSKEFYNFHNQRAALCIFENEIFLAWERTENTNSSIWSAKIDEKGIVKNTSEQIVLQKKAFRPEFFVYKNNLFITWFDSRNGNESVYFAKKEGEFWNEYAIAENENSNIFINPLILNSNGRGKEKILSFVWQQNSPKNQSSIVIIVPDKTITPPTLVPINFKKNHRANSKKAQIQITFPQDSSGIKSYSYTWSKNQDEQVLAIPMESVKANQKSVKQNLECKNGDGIYYFSVKIQDYAGNWSEETQIEYNLDSTPPLSPKILFDNCDENHILNSNNFKISWEKSPEIDTSGYVYKLEYLFKIPSSLADSSRHPCELSNEQKQKIVEDLQTRFEKSINKNKNLGTEIQTLETSSQKFYDYSNGVYAFYVAAVDDLGNVGKPNVEMFIMNKFEPQTYVNSAKITQDELGQNYLTIDGGGFTYDGIIDKIIIDDDGLEPFSQFFLQKNDDFKIESNNLISNIKISSEIEEGSYKLILHHTDRGNYKTENIFSIGNQRSVKIEAEYNVPKTYNEKFSHKKSLLFYIVIFGLLLIFCVIIIFFIINQFNFYLTEKILIKKQVQSIFEGKIMPMKQIKNKLKHQKSLKKQFMIFTVLIIIFAVAIIAIQSGSKNILLQEKTMATGLENRIEVLEESLSSGVRNFLPTNNILELSSLPAQKDAMSEIEYITIVGQSQNEEKSKNLNVIWATNDPKYENQKIEYGVSAITDEEYLSIIEKCSLIDANIPQKIIKLSDSFNEFLQNSDKNYSSVTEDEREVLDSQESDFRKKINDELLKLSKIYSSSFPNFDVSKLDLKNTEYLFYSPVLYRQGNSKNYVHAVIFIKLSTQNLISSIKESRNSIIRNSLIVAFVTILLGVFISYLFATLMVRPLKKLEKYVTMIGRTKNKIELKGKELEIKSKDEIGRLSVAINNMTEELVRAAEEDILRLDGKSVQNAFLPLEKASTIARYDDSKIQCFGYYEGESGVSGDYFDYHKLSEDWFIAIKCDASGHGVPAAIIMTVVATLFREYYENWNFQKDGTQINKLIEQINDAIETLGLMGKFAAIIICLINQKTGEVYICNSGDPLVHIYDSFEQKVKTLSLEEYPVAGVFPSSMISEKLKVEKLVLNHNDVLFLYTDGIEESKRVIRDSNFAPKMDIIQVKNSKNQKEENASKFKEQTEDFGSKRIFEIIESVMTQKKYVLLKQENPIKNEILEFDFSSSNGSISDAIIALASCEKIFRLYKPNGLTRTDYVKVDKKIDEFLKNYFNNYELYSRHKTQNPETPNYVDYEHLKEDEQSDDLTLLAIRRI